MRPLRRRSKNRRKTPRLVECLLLISFALLPFALSPSATAQVIADRTIATVTNGSQATPDVITYSDLVWQLALEPGTPFSERPGSNELRHALESIEDQLLILQEARKLPTANTPEAIAKHNKDVQDRRDELARLMGSAARLQERMTRVGLTSEQLDAILRDRVVVEDYLDFRFRAFVVVTPKEITDRYNQDYGRLRNTGRIVPTLDSVRDQIEQKLKAEKEEEQIDKFVDSLREQPGTEIVILSPV
ncbi:MAG TPA: hypothetical protein VHD88_03790 [Pyrinomonadaceae bacterium]|nr:hypothetical protein [Pyrinomonadaceae bacterium]